MAEPPPPRQYTFEFFLRKIIAQAAELTELIDAKKRFRQEKVQIIILTAVTAGFCILGAYVIYGIGK